MHICMYISWTEKLGGMNSNSLKIDHLIASNAVRSTVLNTMYITPLSEQKHTNNNNKNNNNTDTKIDTVTVTSTTTTTPTTAATTTTKTTKTPSAEVTLTTLRFSGQLVKDGSPLLIELCIDPTKGCAHGTVCCGDFMFNSLVCGALKRVLTASSSSKKWIILSINLHVRVHTHTQEISFQSCYHTYIHTVKRNRISQ